jgi:hypothetical protein
MKIRLLAILILLSGIVNAQCDATFSYSFDSATDKLTCWPNDTAGEHEWNVDNGYYFLGSDGITMSWHIDTLKLTLPYGHNEILIGHYNTCGYYTETVVVDNLDGNYCDARFYSGVEPAQMVYTFYGTQNPSVNHAWLYGTDTISTTYHCGVFALDAFQLTHIVYDNNGCSSSVTDTFYHDTFLSCHADPSIMPLQNGLPYEYNLRSYSSNFLNHTWTIDGDTVSHGFSFNYTLLPGLHNVCLTVSSDSCSDTYCYNIDPDNNTIIINPRLEDNLQCTTCVTDATAWLYKLEHADTTTYGVLVGSTALLNNLFTFSSLPNGEYIVRAALNPTNSEFENYLPTYNYSEEDWDAAYAINLYGVVWNQDPLNMVLLSVNLNPGSGLIGGGVIIEDTVRSMALENVMVYVRNQQGVITKYDLTDANGVFQLTNLAFGTYALSADIPGYICPPQTVTINAQNPAFSEVELHLYPVTDLLASLNQTENKFSIGTPYPNPTESNLSIPINAVKTNQLAITVYNLLGQPVLNQNNMVSTGNHTILLPTESLAQGIYILQIADKKTGAVVTKKIVKD